ncbi:hypothetical protein CW752_08650 [Chryseobacterium sp. PMSZPI]|nr:hypothetical protein CW752_08650 [Chryseobacterium sp. PMSZPI]
MSPVSSLYQNEKIAVISAEKHQWTGGRAGVKGMMYIVKLKKKSNDSITIKTLWAEGHNVSFRQSDAGNTITIIGNLPYKNTAEDATFENTQVGAPVEKSVSLKIDPKDNWIEYTVKGSKVSNKINISKFTSAKSSGDFFP